jgi:hypothetical protein
LRNFLFARNARKPLTPHGEEARKRRLEPCRPRCRILAFILRDGAYAPPQDEVWQKMKACSSALHRAAAAFGKKRNIAASDALLGCLQQERPMLKTLITVSTVLLTTAAFAQGTAKSPGSSEYAPGQKMQKSKTSTAPGASEYAPGHQKNTAKGPGHSESAPGKQTTTGSAKTKKKY